MRLKNMLRNSMFGLGSQLIIIVVGFFYQRVLNLYMGKELVGANGVIANIIAILSVSEMGISTAIVFHLYEALNSQNERKIASLINIYRKAYLIFSGFIVVVGVGLAPFIKYFIKDSGFTGTYLSTLFLLWIVKTASANILSYKRSILIADQKEYIVTIATFFITVLNYGICILIVALWKNYILSFSINIAVEITINLVLNRYIDKRYSYLKKYKKEKVEEKTFKGIVSDLKNLFVSKFSGMLLTSTDNLIISSFINAGVVGLFSNYTMITLSLYNISRSISNAIQPTIGNLFLEKDYKKDFFVLRELTFVFFFIASTAATGVICFCSYFVGDFWLNNDFLLSNGVVIVLGINCFIYILSLPITVLMNVSGMFSKIKFASVAMALANIVFSLILVVPFGVLGVVIGTMLAYIIQLVLYIKYMVKDYLSEECKTFALDLIIYLMLAVIDVLLVKLLLNSFYVSGNFFAFIGSFLICLVLPNLISLLVFMRNWRIKKMIALVKESFGKKNSNSVSTM